MNPDVVAIGGIHTNNLGWSWSWSGLWFDKSHVGWTTAPSLLQGDCLGISANVSTGVVYPCSELKRVMCAP